MAILFRILFTLGLLILHVSVLSAQTQVNRNGPETPLKFISENPSYLLASTLKNTPTYLNCHVSAKVDRNLQLDLETRKFYQEASDDVDDEEEDDPDENHTKITEEQIREMYQKQYVKQMNKSNPIPESIAVPPPSKVDKALRRTTRSPRDNILYEWLRDDETVISSKNDMNQIINLSAFTLFQNGTLKFQASNATAGEYRCLAKYIDKQGKFEIGPIMSQATVVEIANLMNDSNDKKNLTIFEAESTVISCPISSVPEGNYSWYFNNNEMSFDVGIKQKDIRHFLLTNGSLLIVNSRISDSGKYRCNATNQFAKKLFRSSFSMLNVMSRPDDIDNHGSRLLQQLQSSTQKIKSGLNLILHCASYTNKEKNKPQILWTFTPRTSSIPINVPEFNNELKYVNVSVTKHDGIYNCSTDGDFQVFDVSVVTPPQFLQPSKSMVTSVPASIKFNCSVSGNPMPKVEWYKNGKKLPNNHVKHFEYPIAKIETIDPEDEGLYQCLARNDYGEVSSTFYLHVRPTFLLDHSPQNAKCQPMDKNVIEVTFDKEAQTNKIQYFIASDSPRDFYSTVTLNYSSISFKIDTSMASIFKPLKPFYLYMRNIVPNGGKMIVSQLSQPIICASQGIAPKFVKPPSGIFLRWDTPSTDSNVTSFTIQFQNNKTSNPVIFINEVIGSYEKWPTYVSWNDVQNSLQRISVKNSNKTDWNEVQVPGNVTGLYIINTEEINVRIFGTVLESGELLDQNLEALSWTNIKASSISLEPLKLGEIDSRGVEIFWNGLDSVKCAHMCAELKQDFISRDSRDKFKCELIHSLSAKTFNLRNLRPTSDYNVFIQDCDNNAISTKINFQTKRDVPGPVTQSHIITDGGIVLHWKPPHNPNGEIYNYLLEWTFENVTHKQNVSELNFKFPNTTSADRFNITVKAFGVAGLGYPLIINPDKWGILPHNNMIGSAEQQNTTIYFDSFMIFAIIFISLILVVLVVGYVVCRRHRICKNSNGIINSEQSSFPPTTSPLAETIRSEEMYEMQTLIPASQLVSANGKDVSIRSENPSNGGMSIRENQKVLRTSTPTDESVDQMCIELPPIKCDDSSTIQIEELKTPNGFLGTFHSKPVLTTEQKDPKNGLLKVNGNSSPFKCFQSSGNDQNSSSESTSFDSNRQLIETNLCNSLNNNSINDHSKIGKSSSIETDNEEEDSEENLHEYDLNDSNLSSKPLHPMNWDFRRPLVGPNG